MTKAGGPTVLWGAWDALLQDRGWSEHAARVVVYGRPNEHYGPTHPNANRRWWWNQLMLVRSILLADAPWEDRLAAIDVVARTWD